MFDPLSQYVRLQLSDSLANQASGGIVAVGGGTVFVDQPGKFKTNGLIFSGLSTGVLTVTGAAGMVPGADVEATTEMFIRPSALGGNEQMVATWTTDGGTAVRVVIRNGRWRLEVASGPMGAWDSPAGQGPLVLWDEWQFIAVIQEIDPTRRYMLYVGSSGVATLAGVVADPGLSTPANTTSPMLRMASWPAGTVLREFLALTSQVRDASSVWVGNLISLGCAAPPAGTVVSIQVSGGGPNYPAGTVDLGGTIGAGQTIRDFVDAVVVPNITAHMGAYPQALTVSEGSPLGGTTENNVVINWGGQRTIVVAPTGTELARFRGNVSELRVTTVRRRYFDPFSTPANQPVTVPVTSWDGGGEATVGVTAPAMTGSASGGPGTSVTLTMPKPTLTATATQGAAQVPGAVEVGTSLVMRDTAYTSASVDGVAYTHEFSGTGIGSHAIARASMSRATGKWYFEVTSSEPFIAGVLSASAIGADGPDLGAGATIGYGVEDATNGYSITGGGSLLTTDGSIVPPWAISSPGTLGVIFDADTKTFLTIQEMEPGLYGETTVNFIPISAFDTSGFMTGPFYPAVRSSSTGSPPGATLTVNFGASPFAFSSVPESYGASAFDPRPLTPTVVGARTAGVLPKLSAKGHTAAQVQAAVPRLHASATVSLSPLSTAELRMPAMVMSGQTGHNAAVKVPAITAAATGTVVAVAQVRADLPMLRIAADGRVSDQVSAYLRPRVLVGEAFGGAHAAGVLSAMTVSAAATAGGVAHMRGVIRALTLQAAGSREETVSAALTLPALETRPPAKAVMNAPSLRLSSVVTEVYGPAAMESYSVNLRRPLDENPRNQYDSKNSQVTRYTGFPFSRIVRFMGEYYGVADDGLYRIGGDTDAGQPVAWDFEMCTTDFGDPHKKNVHSLYVGGTLPNTVQFTIKSGESVEQVHEATILKTDVTKNYRQVFGRGRQARYYAFGLAGSGPLDVDTTEFAIASSTRRI